MAAEPEQSRPATSERTPQLTLFGQSVAQSDLEGFDRHLAPAELRVLPHPPVGTTGILADADRAALAALEAALTDARARADARPPLVVLASCLGQFGVVSASALPAAAPSLRQARDDWLLRLETSEKSESARVAYRVAIDGLLDWTDAHGRNPLDEATIVEYLAAYRERGHPAEATYYRRFVLLRRFLQWVCRRAGVPDPFLDLEAPRKPRQERDWLTPEEFRRLLDAAGRPERNLPGLVERDRLALLTLVTTGLRRSELCALDWRDLELDGRRRSLLVRCGKGSKPRRQPLPAGVARELRKLRDSRQPQPNDPVFCGLAGGRLQESTLADIIRRGAARADIQKHVTAHTLRHTAATWLRQELGDARLVAEYLGHADLSTVSRYAHVERDELFDAAGRLERLASSTVTVVEAPSPTPAAELEGSHEVPDRNRDRHRRRRHRRRRRRA